MDDNIGEMSDRIVGLTVRLVSAYVSNNHVHVGELPALLLATRAALAGLGQAGTACAATFEKAGPAQITSSITHEALISFEDGKHYKTLRRHLRVHGLTPETYRKKWGLPFDYPMTAAGYSARRSQLARGFGLGREASPSSTDAKLAGGRGPAALTQNRRRRGMAKAGADFRKPFAATA